MLRGDGLGVRTAFLLSPRTSGREGSPMLKNAIRLAVVGVVLLSSYSAAQSNSQFDTGNFVIVRTGDGVTTTSNAATPVTLLEVDTVGSFFDSKQLPAYNFGGNNQGGFTLSGTATSEGGLSLTTNGTSVVLAGYDAELGTSSVSITTSATANRVVASVLTSNLSVDVKPRLSGDSSFSGNNVRSVASDGTKFYLSGNASSNADRGVRYAAGKAATSATQIINANTRQSLLVNDRVVYATQTSILRTSSALPTTTDSGVSLGITLTDAGQFAFFDRSASVGDSNLGGVDTLYVADNSTSSSLRKFEFDGTSWVARGVAATSVGLFGLAGYASGTQVVLLTSQVANVDNNKLFRFIDTSAFGSLISGSFVEIGSAGAKYRFKGIAFVPEPAALSLLALGALGLRRRRT